MPSRLLESHLATARFLLIICGILFPGLAIGQDEFAVSELPNAPVTSRFNDAFFRSDRLGWIVNGDGEIFRTTDGGSSWNLQFVQSDAHFRSVAFLTDQHGFAGNVGPGEFGATDPNLLYETTDGGATWLPVSAISGPAPGGICGMYVVNDTTIVAVGRVRGPAFFLRTTDAGRTWVSHDLSEYAAGLIDAHFTHPDTGFVAGLSDANHTLSSGVVLKTEDGGVTWVRKHITPRQGEWIWKLSFPSRRVGYASLQRNSGAPIDIVKTVDGGESWTEMRFLDTYYFVQGIGFIDELNGWIGGNSTDPVYMTDDGGQTWRAEQLRPRLNRFRFLGDSLGYAVGRTVHRIRRIPQTGPDAIEKNGFRLSAAWPNPASRGITIRYELPSDGPVRLDVVDASGRTLQTIVDRQRSAGVYAATWDGRVADGGTAASGTYFITMTASDIRDQTTRLTQSVVVVR
ncbi:MAG: T9SS type A sorting domain-containing protein [Bacteroidetes bacterium]|nr:T9SS type A sorting domain-containing protein [Bacteroidota bacterium]